MDKEAIEECMYDFGVWMSRCSYAFTKEDRDAFFADRGIEAEEFFDLALRSGVLLTMASYQDPEPEGDWLTCVQKFFKFLWR